MKPKTSTTLAICALWAMSSFANVNLDLSFSGADVTYTVQDDYLEYYIEDAATGVDVRISSVSPYIPDTELKGGAITNGGNNGSIAGDDLRIHLNSGSSTRFRFELLDASSGLLFQPPDLSYNLLVYDLDGLSTASGGADKLTFYSPLSFTLTDTSNIDVETTENSISFSDADAGEVDGQTGLSQAAFEASADQQNISVGLEFGIASWEFEYSIDALDQSGSGRNLLFDAGDLAFTLPTTTTVTTIPEPASLGVLILAGSALFWVRRIFMM